jgi:hypothetical protein
VTLFKKEALVAITSVLIGCLAYYSWKYAFGKNPTKRFAVTLAIVISTALLFYAYLFLTRPEGLMNDHHWGNISGLFLAFVFLQALRAVLDQLDVKAREGRFNFDKVSFQKNARDMVIEFTVFGAIYVMIAYASAVKTEYRFYALTGCLFSIFPILKVLKYRIYDDLYKRWLHKGGSFIGPITSVPTTLLQGIYNVLFRAYLLIALSFACIYTLLYFDSIITDGMPVFSVNNASGNLFVDFIYFSIITMSTVGYGDISPIGVIPKLLCASQVLLGYFFIGSTFAYIFFVISVQSSGVRSSGKTNKKT